MKRLMISSFLAVVTLGIGTGAGVFAADHKTTTDRPADAAAACMDMMQGAGVTDDGKKAMRDFMSSDKASQAMTNMMEMARRMGNGDPMLGMTKMMEMMGSMGGGGMMGGQGGMTQPGPRQPDEGHR